MKNIAENICYQKLGNKYKIKNNNSFLHDIANPSKQILLIHFSFLQCVKEYDDDDDNNVHKEQIESTKLMNCLRPIFSETFLRQYERAINTIISTRKQHVLVTPLFKYSLFFLNLLHVTKMSSLPVFTPFLEPLIEMLILSIHPDEDRRPNRSEILDRLL
jgi:hypothetical protein